ncbi:PREDICTED: insulin-like growth factor-binding protein 3 [Chrysochloris asiatica]|uniref:Insulin-like growth factor-binding protein 3 n=1 Tax=Chrysochloris asiatica TaxID=185453 RepID=A0A9B0WGU1_CHRAS|nr:PREDICTED: insulin-like growth factor-binding protein 3 [Chrysochloris asiatica]
MEQTRCALWAATLTTLALLSGPPVTRAGAGLAGAGPVVRCEPCDARALEQCAPPPSAPACTELVREPGCGCCLTCALREGQPCGVYTERCGTDLRCQPQPAEPRPLQALLDGRGLCTNASAADRLLDYLLHKPPASGNASESEEEHNAGGMENPDPASTHRVPDSKLHPLHTKMDVIKKGHAKESQRYKLDYESQSTDTQNFSSESKRETEYGPCRREMEDTLNHLKFLNVLSPRGVHIPNCDKKGFYKKKQCRPSKGRKRGFCWCVDKYGQPLPGYNAKGKGDVHCYNMDSN